MKKIILLTIFSTASLSTYATTRIPASGVDPQSSIKSSGAGTLAPGVVCDACHALEQGPALLGDSTTVYRKGDSPAVRHNDSDSDNGITN